MCATQEHTSGRYGELIGIPKALLPARPVSSMRDGECILDCWWNALKRCVIKPCMMPHPLIILSISRQQFSEVYLVTNADKLVTCYNITRNKPLVHGCAGTSIMSDGLLLVSFHWRISLTMALLVLTTG